MFFKRYFRRLACVSLLLTFLLSGCADARVVQLEEYKANMERFFENVSAYNLSINAIDASKEDAPKELLGYLDGVNTEFSNLRSYSIPPEFSSISNLTIDAADSMDKAVALYHDIYENTYDAEKAEEARALYNRANRCVQVILQVLHGEEPTGDDLSIN